MNNRLLIGNACLIAAMALVLLTAPLRVEETDQSPLDRLTLTQRIARLETLLGTDDTTNDTTGETR